MSADTPCQRWNSGRHSWRHLREGGFDRRRYQVTDLAEADAKAFCAAHHYAGASYPAAIRRYGLIDRAGGRLVGAAVLGAPVSSKVLTGPLPTLEPYRESVELSRFVLLDECPANTESWMLTRAFEDLRAHGIRGVVSFADPVPRWTAAGVLIKPGHFGIIYQACGADYTGRGTARSLVMLPRRNGAERQGRPEGSQPRARSPVRRRTAGDPGSARAAHSGGPVGVAP